MKKIITSIVIASFFIAGTASAQVNMMGYGQIPSVAPSSQQPESADLSKAMQDIYQSQNITLSNQINCSKVTDKQFETLGDAYMGWIHPGQAHNTVETMMGGEGSPTLTQAHINMGRSYIGCWSGYDAQPFFMSGLGGYGPMMHTNSYSYQMMSGWGGYGVGGALSTGVLWVLAIIGLISVIKWAIHLNSNKK